MKGIDISNLNGTVDIASVKNAGYGFVISKITEGCTFVDEYGSQNVANTKSNGLIAGAYHFARFSDESRAVQEANFFKANCPSNVDFVVLDFEQQCSGDMTEACIVFLDIISSIAPALIYCNYDYINSYLNSNITKYPLWIANYGVSSPSISKWENYAIWQYSECGSVPGVNGNVDLNVSGSNFNFINKRTLDKRYMYLEANIVGDKNIAVVQASLNLIDIFDDDNKPLIVDGILGERTKQAYIRFQEVIDAPRTGIWDNACNQALCHICNWYKWMSQNNRWNFNGNYR